MIKKAFLFLLLSLSSLAALAIPSVSDVEKTINSGDYVKAKSMLTAVLKEHPDSIVANKYMLEVIKIEYAGSLQPSVEYKLYEGRIKQLEKEKAQRKDDEFRKQFSIFFLSGIFIICAVGGFFIIKPFWVDYMAAKKVAKKERERQEQWVKRAREQAVQINGILKPFVTDKDNFISQQ